MMMKNILLVITLLLLSSFLLGQPNQVFMLDSTFGLNGKVETPAAKSFPDMQGVINSMVLQDDGKIMVAGYEVSLHGDKKYGMMVRYLLNGNIDTTYGDSGFVYSDFNGQNFTRIDVIHKQSSGKIIALAFTRDKDKNAVFFLGRYNTDGSPDSSFGNDGRIKVPSSAYSMVVQPDDRILVCGDKESFSKPTYAVKLRRYKKNGSVDSSFGSDGLATIEIGGISKYNPSPVIDLDKAGRIVVGCFNPFDSTQTNGNLVLRLTGTGVIDSSFNGTGMLIVSGVPARTYFSTLCVQPDNKILLGCRGYSTYNFYIIRITEAGLVDKGFGNDGIAGTDFTPPGQYPPSFDVLTALGVLKNGKIAAVGYTQAESFVYRFAIAKYLSDGKPDRSFGAEGKTRTQINTIGSEANALLIQPDGKVIAGGYAGNNRNIPGPAGNFALVRYLPEIETNTLIADKDVRKTKPIQLHLAKLLR